MQAYVKGIYLRSTALEVPTSAVLWIPISFVRLYNLESITDVCIYRINVEQHQNNSGWIYAKCVYCGLLFPALRANFTDNNGKHL